MYVNGGHFGTLFSPFLSQFSLMIFIPFNHFLIIFWSLFSFCSVFIYFFCLTHIEILYNSSVFLARRPPRVCQCRLKRKFRLLNCAPNVFISTAETHNWFTMSNEYSFSVEFHSNSCLDRQNQASRPHFLLTGISTRKEQTCSSIQTYLKKMYFLFT